jgi:glycosyltransferase involved in cell wall biosynthesis
MKVLVFIVAYNAEARIESVLQRIPAELWNQQTHRVEVLILDDRSDDLTIETSKRFREIQRKYNLVILSNPVNQGYGGNQKLGYYYAIQNNFDVVVLLHGDGQYTPELLPTFIAAFEDSAIDAVFGSRMLKPGAALSGGMPLYKYVGNRILSMLQNWILTQHLSEFHSGYRAYRVQTLKRLPFTFNSPDFDFDTDIIIQLLDTGSKIVEIPIPTYYGDEICHVNGVKYAAKIIATTFRSRLQQYALVYHPKFDYSGANQHYTLKLNQPSSHQWALDRCANGAKAVLDLGCGPGALGPLLRERGCYTMGVDKFKQSAQSLDWFHRSDLDEGLFDLSILPRDPDVVLCLDIIEHLRSPEQFLLELRERLSALSKPPQIIITTPNIAFVLTRFSLLFGSFNYGKKGILDLTHTRLFTFSTLRQTLNYLGYEVVLVKGVPAPFSVALGSGFITRAATALNSSLIWLWRNLFSYQIFVIARALPTLSRLLDDAQHYAKTRPLRTT